jgi:hypothetical protein
MSGRTEESLQKYMTKKGKTKNILCFLVCGDKRYGGDSNASA